MEITENERLMLVHHKERICKATLRILDLENDPKNILLIKKQISIILSLINTIASYSNSRNYDLNIFTKISEALFKMLNPNVEVLEDKNYLIIWRKIVVPDLELFCNYINSIRFDFDKRRLKISIPKIDVSIFRHG